MKVFVFMSKDHGVLRIISGDNVVSLGSSNFACKLVTETKQVLKSYRSNKSWIELK